MSIQSKIEQLDKELQEMNVPFDKGLPILQEKLWELAKEYNTTGDEILMQYMNWKALQSKKE